MKLFTLAAIVLAFAPLSLAAQTPGMISHGTPGMAVEHMKPPVPASRALSVTFRGHTMTFTIDDLLKLPQVTVRVHNAHRNTDESYTGPLVSDLLAKAGLSGAHENEALILHSDVVAAGTDHYFVIYSAAEMEPEFSKSQVIVAVTKAGKANTQGGLIELVNTDGAKPARWVHGLASLKVMTLAPEPKD